MTVPRVFLLALEIVLISGVVSNVHARNDLRWLVYYTNKAPAEAFKGYSLLVFDSKFHPPLRPLSNRGKTLLGYLSLGEVEQYRDHFRDVKADGILLQENEHWKGSFYVDARDRRWTKRVIEQLIPDIIRKGFNGLFLDTLDNPAELEREQPKKYAGMTKAAARLVRTIRRHYPTIKIMMNRAYELLPLVEQHIDIVLGESVFSDYDFQKETYDLVPQKLYRRQVKLLQAARARQPKLQVLTLDYWDPADSKGITRIYREQRANGFVPYVATIELDRIIEEPRL
ncbi:MAG: endo alpha-1,4 polygalactosaminidase [Candidatus Binatia bacterium]